MGRRVTDVFPGVEAFGLLDVFRRVWRTGRPEQLPVSLYQDERISGWRENYVYKLPSGEVVAAYRDVTEHKQAEEALAFNNTILSTQQETSLDGILVVDEQDRIVSYNQRFVQMWDIPQELVESGADKPVLMTVVGQVADPDGFLARVQYLYAHREEKSREEITLKDGRVFDRYSAPMFGSESRYYGRVWYFRDVTERQRAEAALRESEQRYHSLFDGMTEGFALHEIICNDQGEPCNFRFLEINSAFELLTGLKRDDVIGKAVLDVLPSTGLEQIQRCGAVALTGQPAQFDSYSEEIKRHFEVFAYRPAPGQFATLFMDITEREEAAEALRMSEKRHRLLFESSRDAIMTLDPSSLKFTSGNPASIEMFGAKDEAEFTSFGPLDLSPQFQSDGTPTEEKAEEMMRAAMQNGSRLFEWRHKRMNGQEFPATVLLTRVELGGQVFCQATVRDVTERKHLEAQLRQSQKVEAVGRLAGGIAHDFNNILTGVIGYAELLREKFAMGSPEHDDLEQITKSADRAADLTRQLLAFSRQLPLERTVLDLNAVVGDKMKMLKRVIGEDIELAFLPGEALDNTSADKGQITQVLMNLVVNARDAMPRGGALTIETANIDLDQTFVDTHLGSKEGPYIVLTVSDNGCGMDSDTLEHIFDPFFTTKEQGKGTGLGLSTVMGVVKQHDGYITVYSEPGRGTTFRVYLPSVEAAIAVPESKPLAAPESLGGETVLVVEDEKLIRLIMERILTHRGYTVITAADADQAKKILMERANEIDLLISDVIMPGSDGPSLYDSIRQTHPALKVMFCSGYSDHAIFRDGTMGQGVPYLQKPFSPASLAIKVREVLDG